MSGVLKRVGPDIVTLTQHSKTYLTAFLGSGRVALDTEGVQNPVIDTYDLHRFMDEIEAAYAERRAEVDLAYLDELYLGEDTSANEIPVAKPPINESEANHA